MPYTKTNDREVEPVADTMHFLRDPLECEHLGVTVLECDPGWTGREHDHADDDHEEVYQVSVCRVGFVRVFFTRVHDVEVNLVLEPPGESVHLVDPPAKIGQVMLPNSKTTGCSLQRDDSWICVPSV